MYCRCQLWHAAAVSVHLVLTFATPGFSFIHNSVASSTQLALQLCECNRATLSRQFFSTWPASATSSNCVPRGHPNTMMRAGMKAAVQKPAALRMDVSAPPSSRETGAEEVINSLFGSSSSERAVKRATISTVAVEGMYSESRHTELTYGEFDLNFFFELLRRASPKSGEAFVDIGSGCGRLVLASAMLHSWQFASGIELLEDLHSIAEQSHARLSEAAADMDISLAPCTFVCDEAEAALPRVLRDAGGTTVAFVYATCWPSTGPYLSQLSCDLASMLTHGSRVITVDKELISDDQGQWKFEEIDSVEMMNFNTHRSIGHVYLLSKGTFNQGTNQQGTFNVQQ